MDMQRLLISCFLVICFGLPGCSLSPSPVAGTGVTETELSRAIGKMSFERGLAEHYVSLALAKAKDNPNFAKTVQDKYGRAAALGNALIDKLKLSLTLRKIDADELAQDVKRVAAAVNELHAEVNPPPIGSKGDKMAAAAIKELLAPASIEAIANSALTIWKAAQERDDKLIEDIKKELDQHRWKNWRELDTVI